jgi:pyrimidine-nucleoside phosphorylase
VITSARKELRPAELIQRKRDGEELSAEEIAELVLAYGRGEVPDYQMAAFCMAVYFRGLTAAEMHALTDALVQSGETVDLSPLGRKVVDKHSTGGVGDKTSIALGPLVAACGVPFAKMSGRGLGHTGGTLDKLESIPGFSVDLDMDAFLRQVQDVGVAIIGQTAELVPADKDLYALRDVTATVDIISLIASSIMSKKIAGGADAIVLDVKVGDGAFMKTLESARELAEAMRELGLRAGREVVCELTDMDQPLGRAVGNALEIREAVATLQGNGPEDFVELVLGAASHLLALSDLGVDTSEGRRRAEAALGDGSAMAAYERWVGAQGGDPDLDLLPSAPVVRPVPAPGEGYVQAIAATEIGEAALRLGAGRARKGDAINHAVGLICLAKRGDRVEAGSPLGEVHAATEEAAERAAGEIVAAYRIGAERPDPRPIVLDVIA